MNSNLEQRLSGIISRRRAQTPSGDDVSSHDQQRRKARERVLNEIPHLLSRISSVVAELNDRLSDEGIIIVLASADHRPAAEAVYTLTLAGGGEDEPTLSITIDWMGALRAVLCNGSARSLISASTVFDLDKARIADMAVTLLEAQYH